MSSQLSETTTVAEWLEKLPTQAQLLDPKLEPSDIEKQAHSTFIRELFDEVDNTQLCGLIVDAMGVLQEKDLRRAYKTCEVMMEVLQDEMIEMHMPAPLVAIIKMVREGRDKS